jgi:DNA-binding transcriptional LysR family regulator
VIVDRNFDAAGVTCRTAIVVNDIPFLLGFVERGLGIAVVPRVVRRFPATVRYVSLTPRQPWWHLVAAYAGDRPASAAVRALCALLRGRRVDAMK